MMRRTVMGLLSAALVAAVAGGCAARSSGRPPETEESVKVTSAEAYQVPVPPESPLAKVKEGMAMREVKEILGAPTDMHQYMTGKAFIPWYFGDDASRVAWHYEGVGRVVFTGGGAFGQGGGQVQWVEYDPEEPGYRR